MNLGYRGDGIGVAGCLDIDECAESHKCHPSAICINKEWLIDSSNLFIATRALMHYVILMALFKSNF